MKVEDIHILIFISCLRLRTCWLGAISTWSDEFLDKVFGPDKARLASNIKNSRDLMNNDVDSVLCLTHVVLLISNPKVGRFFTIRARKADVAGNFSALNPNRVRIRERGHTTTSKIIC